MRIVSKGNVTVVQTPAKVNLTLDILGKRTDGFHEVETVLCPVSLFDEVTVELTESPEILIRVRVDSAPPPVLSGEPGWVTPPAGKSDPAWAIPEDASNLAVRAVASVRQSIGDSRGALVTIRKRIPAAAGLGGGSSDAAAAIVAYLCCLQAWDRELATRLAASLGSDVPFFLGNTERIGVAVATGRGDECVVCDVQPDFPVLITHPAVGCSTVAIYREFAKQNSWTPRPEAAGGMLEALRNADLEKIGAGLLNALQFSAGELNPWIDKQLDLLRGFGLNHVLMSGSGSACFALGATEDDYEGVHRRAVELGIPRAFATQATWFPSIEKQIDAQQSG